MKILGWWTICRSFTNPWNLCIIKIIGVSLSDQHQAFVVYLDLLQLVYSVLWNRDNLVNNQLCNHLLDQLQFFKCYQMFLNHFLLLDDQKVLFVNHNIAVFYFYFWEKIPCVSCLPCVIFKWQNKKSIYSPKTWIN